MPDFLESPAPWELLLDGRPQDRGRFSLLVEGIVWRSRPGLLYRVPWWASPARRREARRNWERDVCILVGSAYELGRQPGA